MDCEPASMCSVTLRSVEDVLVLKVPMPNKGWGHFEGGRGLARVKHPCFDVGDGLSQKREMRKRSICSSITIMSSE